MSRDKQGLQERSEEQERRISLNEGSESTHLSGFGCQIVFWLVLLIVFIIFLWVVLSNFGIKL